MRATDEDDCGLLAASARFGVADNASLVDFLAGHADVQIATLYYGAPWARGSAFLADRYQSSPNPK
jgi:hypothetical protein